MEGFKTELISIAEEHTRILQKIVDSYKVEKYETELAKERALDFEKPLYNKKLIYLQDRFQKRCLIRDKWYSKAKDNLAKRAMKTLTAKDRESILDLIFKMKSR